MVGQPNIHASSYSARTTVSVAGPLLAFGTLNDGVERPPPAIVILESGSKSSAEDATAAIELNLTRLTSYSGAAVEKGEFVLDQLSVPSDAWKALVFGGVIGALLAIGFAYVWDDARTYRKQLSAST